MYRNGFAGQLRNELLRDLSPGTLAAVFTCSGASLRPPRSAYRPPSTHGALSVRSSTTSP